MQYLPVPTRANHGSCDLLKDSLATAPKILRYALDARDREDQILRKLVLSHVCTCTARLNLIPGDWDNR